MLVNRGVPMDLYQLVSSYLSNCHQFVQVGQAQSESTPIPSGMAQGSLLGPFLFNVPVDEIFRLAQLSNSSHLLPYADDTTYLKQLSDAAAEADAQKDVVRILEAFSQLGLSINILKTKYLISSPTGASEIPLIIKMVSNCKRLIQLSTWASS